MLRVVDRPVRDGIPIAGGNNLNLISMRKARHGAAFQTFEFQNIEALHALPMKLILKPAFAIFVKNSMYRARLNREISPETGYSNVLKQPLIGECIG